MSFLEAFLIRLPFERAHSFNRLAFIALVAVANSSYQANAAPLLPPETGAYHGAYADFGPTEDQVTVERIRNFEAKAGKKIAWAYFSNHWLDGKIEFPTRAFEECGKAGVIPYVRLSPWSEMRQNRADEVFSMKRIVSGEYDLALRHWARNARDTKQPLMIEFGPEVNGSWFPWNGKWNGGATRDRYGDPNWPDGPERFRDAYRHLIDLFRAEGADNVTWVLHVDVSASPEADWNEVKWYYPGDDYIDWIGVSAFGAQLPNHNWRLFPTLLKRFMPQIEEASATKPLLISEFAVIEDPDDSTRKAQWIRQALQSISRGLFKRVKGITWWNSPGWLPEKKANFMIDSSVEALEAYRTELANPFWLGTVPK